VKKENGVFASWFGAINGTTERAQPQASGNLQNNAIYHGTIPAERIERNRLI
jgi:hypothetical protein